LCPGQEPPGKERSPRGLLEFVFGRITTPLMNSRNGANNLGHLELNGDIVHARDVEVLPLGAEQIVGEPIVIRLYMISFQ